MLRCDLCLLMAAQLPYRQLVGPTVYTKKVSYAPTMRCQLVSAQGSCEGTKLLRLSSITDDVLPKEYLYLVHASDLMHTN